MNLHKKCFSQFWEDIHPKRREPLEFFFFWLGVGVGELAGKKNNKESLVSSWIKKMRERESTCWGTASCWTETTVLPAAGPQLLLHVAAAVASSSSPSSSYLSFLFSLFSFSTLFFCFHWKWKGWMPSKAIYLPLILYGDLLICGAFYLYFAP